MRAFSAGIGPLHMVRLIQWTLALPLIWSYTIQLCGLRWPDPLTVMLASIGLSHFHILVIMGIVALGLEVSERMVVQSTNAFENNLHTMLKTIGDNIRGGQAIESAVAEAAHDTSGPGVLFRDALNLSAEMPFESALRAVADTSGRPYFQEVGHLVAMAVNSPGDTGLAIRTLGTELERTSMLGDQLRARISGPLFILQMTGYLFVPALFAMLNWSLDLGDPLAHFKHRTLEASAFFTFAGLAAASVDGVVFDDWGSVPAHMPLALTIIYACLSVAG